MDPPSPSLPSQSENEKTIVGKRWQVLKLKLGEGNYGKVYQGQDLQTGMKVAVKVTNMRNLSKELQQRLRAETEILAKVNHPNIVQLYDQLQNGKYQLLMLEHLQGRDLDRAMVRGQPMPVELVQRLYGDLCCGMQELHRLNIIHRDLKPHNLLLSNTDPHLAILKIADFGFARYLGAVDDMAKTIAGSPLYMAPEVLEAALGSTQRGYGAKVDLFSSGIILYQMLKGEPPYPAFTQVELLQKMRASKRKPLRLAPEHEEAHGANLKHLLDKLLQPDPNRRVDSAGFFNDPWVLGCLASRHSRSVQYAAVAGVISIITSSVHVHHLSVKEASESWDTLMERLSAANAISDIASRMVPSNNTSFCSNTVSNSSVTSSTVEGTALCVTQASVPGVMISLYNKTADLCSAAWNALHSDKPILLEVISLEDWKTARERLMSLFNVAMKGVGELLNSSHDLDCFYDERVDAAELIIFQHAKEVSLRASVEEIMHNDTLAGTMYVYAMKMMRIVAADRTSVAHSTHKKTALKCADLLAKRIKRTTGAMIA